MTISLASQPSYMRLAVIDALRGFALIGVLFANFTGYTDQQVPSEILKSISNKTDYVLMAFNAIFIEYKFVTLFSILFGYSFGLFMDSATKRSDSSPIFFLRRMLWLFVIGVLHTLFWWFDVLHVYAICGLFLLAFRQASPKALLLWSIMLIFFVPFGYLTITLNQPEPLSANDWQGIFSDFKNGDFARLFRANVVGYWRLFIKSGSDIYYFTETLGKFLFGYFLFRVSFFDSIETKAKIITRTVFICGPIALVYFIGRVYALKNEIDLGVYYIEPFVKVGILATSCLYASLLILYFTAAPYSTASKLLQNLGRMTLTNYLLVSLAMLVLLYGIGFGLMGEIPLRCIWVLGIVWLVFEIVFSSVWLMRFKYGPVEGLWRKLTWGWKK